MVSVQEFQAFKSYIEAQFAQANEVTQKNAAELQEKMNTANEVYHKSSDDLQAKLNSANQIWTEADQAVAQRIADLKADKEVQT